MIGTLLAFLACCCVAAAVPQQDDREWDTPPVVIYRVDPEYPEEAKEAKTSGNVVLKILVETDGTTTILEVVEELENGCTEAAIAAVEQWKWKPALKDGEPVAAERPIYFHFAIR